MGSTMGKSLFFLTQISVLRIGMYEKVWFYQLKDRKNKKHSFVLELKKIMRSIN